MMALHIPNATKWENGKASSRPSRLAMLEKMRYGNYGEKLPSTLPLQLAKGKREKKKNYIRKKVKSKKMRKS